MRRLAAVLLVLGTTLTASGVTALVVGARHETTSYPMPPTTATTAPSLPLDPAVTQETINMTICNPVKTFGPHGDETWTAAQRPPTSYTDGVKIDRLSQLPPEADHDPADYQLDHIISLDLGGAPRDPRNLRLQSVAEARRWDVDLEVPLSRAVCDGLITLHDAQAFEWEHKVG